MLRSKWKKMPNLPLINEVNFKSIKYCTYNMTLIMISLRLFSFIIVKLPSCSVRASLPSVLVFALVNCFTSSGWSALCTKSVTDFPIIWTWKKEIKSPSTKHVIWGIKPSWFFFSIKAKLSYWDIQNLLNLY